MFIFIILINTTVGIVQEIRAKRQIERLTLLLAVAVMRGGKEQRIRPEELRKGDAPVLAAGNAVCTDCIWQEGRPEVNEAIPSGSGCADGGFLDWTEPFESLPDRVSPRTHHGDQRMEADFLIAGRRLRTVVTFPLFMLTYLPVTVAAIVCKPGRKPIAHSKRVSAEVPACCGEERSL